MIAIYTKYRVSPQPWRDDDTEWRGGGVGGRERGKGRVALAVTSPIAHATDVL